MFDAGAGLVEKLGEEGGLVLFVVLVGDDRGDATRPGGSAVGPAGIALVADGGARCDVGSDVEQRGEVRRIRFFAAGQVEGDQGSRCV